MSDKTYQLRMDQDLYDKVRAKGSDWARQALASALGVVAGIEHAEAKKMDKLRDIAAGKAKTPKPVIQNEDKPVLQPSPDPSCATKVDRRTLAEMVAANEAKMQANKARIALGNGLNA